MLKLYVCGFLFSPDKQHVVLIKKNKPDWQKGKLNGVGGKVEDEDLSFKAAMIREFKEETGQLVESWEQYAEIYGDGYRCIFFKAFSDYFRSVESTTDEKIHVCHTELLLYNNSGSLIPNLKYLIPMALDENIVKAEIIENS